MVRGGLGVILDEFEAPDFVVRIYQTRILAPVFLLHLRQIKCKHLGLWNISGPASPPTPV